MVNTHRLEEKILIRINFLCRAFTDHIKPFIFLFCKYAAKNLTTPLSQAKFNIKSYKSVKYERDKGYYFILIEILLKMAAF